MTRIYDRGFFCLVVWGCSVLKICYNQRLEIGVIGVPIARVGFYSATIDMMD
ncbi:MAG TPA: hypothetical protein VKX31_03225 [Brumimicrobium sp.]|nr:hypothetical protein [Brumimicrobium sp.]